ncbi:glycoside hydrolase family 3 C-terminal domain-containing protein [Algoriphagus marincola]|uniref:beta-glucosidase n=1 Tax=Algoriphagus marincola TaxID=264027 RepID=A0ABS7N1J7_9BACT|nr:glycoside hydrolase family 3 N-terminal domain-containing protein [Algoriphagus marincola]MBY5950206.1 glycoside hydrolase family 3 C-terminal domain-containing protein [Algoriphagus marincola]
MTFKLKPDQEQKIEDLISQMTLEEKIGQMSQVRHFDDVTPEDIKSKFIGSVIHTQGPVPGSTVAEWQDKFSEFQKQALDTRLKIPLLFGVDAIHGQNTFEGATIFPHNIGLGAAGNPEIVERAAAITAIESKATGFNWVFSPCVAIPFNEKWGRVYEAFSESTELTSKLTQASVKGHQGSNGNEGVLATAKHFIGDGATDFGVEGGNTSLTKEELIERLLPPYQAAVDSGVASVMASFNTLNEIPMHAHKAMITDLLKDQLKFDGIVVSDWKAYSRFGQNEIINAGIDMVMAVDGDLDGFQEGVKAGVLNGSISEERINDAVRRILRQKFRFGLFENPFPDKGLIQKIGIPEHRAIARQAVRESLVLLKNQNQALPLKRTSRIVVVGKFADNSGLQSGGWTVNWQGMTENYSGATTILEGIRKFALHEVKYDPDGTASIEDVDVAVIVVGENPYAEFFGDVGGEMNLFQLTLTEEHQQLVQSYSQKGIKIVLVLISGRPLVITPQMELSDAFVAAWLPGSEGDGIAEVLFGFFDFKGKLPHSWPKSVEDFNGKYGPNYWESSIEPLFPIGFGQCYHQEK